MNSDQCVPMSTDEGDDITKAKRVDHDQQISERRFSEFFATLDANPAACEGLGYEKEELIGKPLSTIYAPESQARLRDLFEKWKKTRKLRNEEMVVLTKQGKKRTVLLNAGSVVDAKGKLLHSTSVQVDITERKRIEQKLRESEERVTDIIASAMDAIITIDDEQRIVMFNAAAERMFGCPERDAIGSHIKKLIPKRFQMAHEAHVTDFSKTGITARSMGAMGSLWGFRANGEEFPIEASISQHEVDGRKQFTAVIRDITERIRADSALREGAERFRLAMNNVASGLYTLDLQGLVTYVNPSAETMFGWTNAELLGKKMHDVTHYKHPDGTLFPASECPGLQVLQKGAELREHEDCLFGKMAASFPLFSVPRR
jgi:PAS domain S-box-containing protein